MTIRPWALAVDYGTSNTVAAVAEVGRVPRLLQFSGSVSLPSCAYFDPTAHSYPWLVGQAAERAAQVEPGKFEPSPKRAIPMGSVFVADREIPVRELIAATLRAVFREAWRQQDDIAPELIVLTHPAGWPQASLDTLIAAARLALTGDPVRLLTVDEPVAAAWHAAESRRVPDDARLAILDLGGGTCDVAVVDRSQRSFRLAGPPIGLDPLGGEDFDVRLLTAVLEDLDHPELHRHLLAGSAADLAAYRDLRRSCRDAKEHLSTEVRAHVRVPVVRGVLPDGASVQVSRPHRLEPLLLSQGPDRPGLDTAADLTAEALQVAPPSSAPTFVFLVGGSSRIPMLGQLVQSRTGLRPLEHGDPATAVAQGAAAIATDALSRLAVPAIDAATGVAFEPPSGPPASQQLLPPHPVPPSSTSNAPFGADSGRLSPGPDRAGMPNYAAGHRVPVESAPTPPDSVGKQRSRRPMLGAAALALLACLVVAGVVLIPRLTAGSMASCWDGTTAKTVAACPPIEGKNGLNYVFKTAANPAFDCTEGMDSPIPALQTSLVCNVRGHPDSSSIRLVQWLDPASAAEYYDSTFAASGKPVEQQGEPGTRWQTSGGATSMAAWTYDSEPFGYEVLADTDEELARLEALLTPRTTAELAAAGPMPTGTMGPSYRCWDGSMAVDVDACPALEGTKALVWIFETDSPENGLTCQFSQQRPDPAMQAAMSCTVDGVDGATVVFSQWSSSAEMRGYFQTRYGTSGQVAGVGEQGNDVALRWKQDTPDSVGQVTSAWGYREYPYAIEIVAPSVQVRDLADSKLKAPLPANLDQACPIPQ